MLSGIGVLIQKWIERIQAKQRGVWALAIEKRSVLQIDQVGIDITDSVVDYKLIHRTICL